MKSFFKKFLIIFAMLIPILGATSLATTTPTYAANEKREFGSCDLTLGMKPWDCGVNSDPHSETELADNVKNIAMNISYDVSIIAAYLVIGYIIYGGYLYLSSSGDTGKTANGKKTLTNAFIGLAIVGLANVILNSIHIALLGNAGVFDGGPDSSITANDVVSQMIDWFIAIAGVISAIFVVIGGINYITSSGDPNKTQKAKTTILYALFGLVIVALSKAISAFAIGIINDAESAGDDGGIQGSIISILNGIILISGIISVAFIVLGGARYITSAGDAGRIQKAKSTILFACIGLVVVALAFAIVNFAIKAIPNQ